MPAIPPSRRIHVGFVCFFPISREHNTSWSAFFFLLVYSQMPKKLSIYTVKYWNFEISVDGKWDPLFIISYFAVSNTRSAVTHIWWMCMCSACASIYDMLVAECGATAALLLVARVASRGERGGGQGGFVFFLPYWNFLWMGSLISLTLLPGISYFVVSNTRSKAVIHVCMHDEWMCMCWTYTSIYDLLVVVCGATATLLMVRVASRRGERGEGNRGIRAQIFFFFFLLCHKNGEENFQRRGQAPSKKWKKAYEVRVNSLFSLLLGCYDEEDVRVTSFLVSQCTASSNTSATTMTTCW